MGDFPQRGAFRAVWTFKGTWQWVALFSVLSPLFGHMFASLRFFVYSVTDIQFGFQKTHDQTLT